MTLEAPGVVVQPVTARKVDRLLRVVLVCGAIASLISAAMYYMEYGTLFPGHSANTTAYSIGRIDGSVLYTYDVRKKQLHILELPNESGANLPVIDVVKNPDNSSYYVLLEKEDIPVSNLFYKATDGSVVKLTSSESFKSHISVDQSSGQVAYQSAHIDSIQAIAKPTQWDLVLLTLQHKTEKIVATGEAPVLLPGGANLLFSSKGELRRLGLQTGVVSPVLLQVPKKQLYSISPSTGDIVVFNEISKTLDFYSFSKTGSPDYVKSQPVSEIPTLVEYVGKDVYTVVSTLDKQGSKSYHITSSNNKTTTVQGPNAVSEILQITTL